MVRFKFLLLVSVLAAVAVTLTPSTPSRANASACTYDQKRLGVCPGAPETGGIANGPGVDLTAEVSTRSNGTGNSGNTQNGRGSNTSAPPACTNGSPLGTEKQWNLCGTGYFPLLSRHPEWPPTITAPTTPCTVCSPNTIVTTTDLENFPTHATPTRMEPNGWAITGLAANFWTDATTQIGEGLLLGQPAQVRFTPIGYHWNYGDGTTTTSTTGGASWDNLGLTEFSPTTTSHTYTTTGKYTVTLTIDYHADYSFGDQGWRPVQGTVTTPSTPLTITAANETTVLVAHNCLTNPHGPGC